MHIFSIIVIQQAFLIQKHLALFYFHTLNPEKSMEASVRKSFHSELAERLNMIVFMHELLFVYMSAYTLFICSSDFFFPESIVDFQYNKVMNKCKKCSVMIMKMIINFIMNE